MATFKNGQQVQIKPRSTCNLGDLTPKLHVGQNGVITGSSFIAGLKYFSVRSSCDGNISYWRSNQLVDATPAPAPKPAIPRGNLAMIAGWKQLLSGKAEFVRVTAEFTLPVAEVLGARNPSAMLVAASKQDGTSIRNFEIVKAVNAS